MSLVFNTAKKAIVEGSLDLVADTLKVLLVTNSYVPDADHVFVSAAAAAELSGEGYVGGFGGSGRRALTGKVVTQDDVADRAELDAEDIQWTAISAGTAAAAVIYKPGSSDADSLLIAYVDEGGFPRQTVGGNLVLRWHADGILHLI